MVITGTEKDIISSEETGSRNLHKTGLTPKIISQHSHANKMISPWQTASPVLGGGPGLGCWGACVYLSCCTCLRMQKAILRTFLFKNAEMSFCREGFLASATSLKLNWRSQLSSVGKQSSPGCRRWLQPLLHQLGKGKGWNIPGSAVVWCTLPEKQQELQAEIHTRQQVWGRNLQLKESPAIRGNFSQI